MFRLRTMLGALLCAIVLLAAGNASAQGLIIEPAPQPGVFTDPFWLNIDHHRVSIEVQDQVARTSVDMQFTNIGQALAEGTYLFPLPQGAAVDDLVMVINGVAIEANVLPAEEARAVYDEIVRQYRDPALLEYVGTSVVQANIFPIPPGENRRVEITYSQVLTADNGLIEVAYPMQNTDARAIDSFSLSVRVNGAQPISNVYSPTHPVAISRDGANGFSAGFEASNYVPTGDFSLYYGVGTDEISVNLLTFREGANQDGFFLLLVQPPAAPAAEQVVPKDVIIVLDQSGSMDGVKWEQAQDAAAYVLQQLNPQDRFNVVAFSTGYRLFANTLQDASLAPDAVDWIYTQEALGGTEISTALTQAVNQVSSDRPTTILFLSARMSSVAVMGDTVPNNVRLFTFGVGDDVDTVLLDTLARDFRGDSSYVRPTERVDEEVASLYNRVGAPVMTDVAVNFGGLTTDFVFPGGQLPDLFAGEQLAIVGRYRGDAENVTITLSGAVDGDIQTFVYEGQRFPATAGGEPFIARLWATRRIGDLLNTIRLEGENPELVDAVVDLSVRYGIITPYTSFLITEDDILTQAGREAAADTFSAEAQQRAAQPPSGAAAVEEADSLGDLEAAAAPQNIIPMTATPAGTQPFDSGAGTVAGGQPDGALQTVNDKTFILQGGVWTDTTFDPSTMTTQPVTFLSDEYFALLTATPALADYFAVGTRVIVVLDGVAYEVVE